MTKNTTKTVKAQVEPEVLKEDTLIIESHERPAEDQSLSVVEQAAIDPNGQIIFTPKHLQLIKDQIAPNSTKEEFELFIMMARRSRLDPLLKQLYFIKYGNSAPSYVTSIDSYRIIAHRTGSFAGVDLPEFTYDKQGKITHCSITVYKLVQGQRFGFSAKVKFSEYTTGKNQWLSKPETMIAKVAEAHAHRKAFPQDLAGIYTTDEMEQAGVTIDGRSGKVVHQPSIKRVSQEQVDEIKVLLEKKGYTMDRLKEYIQKRFKKTTFADVTYKEAEEVIKKLNSFPDVPSLDADPIMDATTPTVSTDDVTVEDVEGAAEQTNSADDFEAFADGEMKRIREESIGPH